MTQLEIPHVFAGNPLDRGEVQRRDPNWLADAPHKPGARFLPLQSLKIALADPESEEFTTPALRWFDHDALREHFETGTTVLLGLENDEPRFAVDICGSKQVPKNCKFTDARHAAMTLDTPSAGIVAQARAQLNWHAKNGYCSTCGNPTESARGGQIRNCAKCESHIFPRTDPVVIMLVCDDTHCLLGQSAMRMPRMKMYSALAGFVDQAESIEEAVRREVREEAGIQAGAVRYHSSQPWPFPSSLMIGAHAEPLTREIDFDPQEMADVRWFTRDEVNQAFAGELEFGLPGEIAIAHHLIKHWLEQDETNQ